MKFLISTTGKFYSAIASLYRNPKTRVILRDFETEFFDCPIGVKQGDCLSPTLFAIFINDLANEIKASKIGIDFDKDTLVNILLYADDIVILAKNENDLQDLLNIVENWCKRWRLEVNLAKTNVMHVRPKRKESSKFMFLFNKHDVPYCKEYKYLGCQINENLDFGCTVSALADSASRALSSVITKMIKNGGLPFSIFCTLYQACVSSIADYGGEVFGFKEYECTKKLHVRAARSYLGVNKHTPVCGILSEFNQLLPHFRRRIKMIRLYHRLLSCNDNITAKIVFRWDKQLNENGTLKSWFSEIKEIFSVHLSSGLENLGNIFNLGQATEAISNSMLMHQQTQLRTECHQSRKLRTFILFKDFFSTPSFLLKPLSFIQRKFLAKLRLGCLELKIETGRFSRPIIPAEQRFCEVCDNTEGYVEDEYHFMIECERYNDERANWLSSLPVAPNIQEADRSEILKVILNESSNLKPTAQYLIKCFDVRSNIISSQKSKLQGGT